MPTYVVTYEAIVTVTVEAETPEEAQEEGQALFRWTDVEIDGVIDIEVDE